MRDILTAKKGDKVFYYSKHGGKELIIIKSIFTVHTYQGVDLNPFVGMLCMDIVVLSKKRIPYALEDLKFE